MKLLWLALSLAAATALHALGTRLAVGFPAAVDLFLVVAVYNSLSGPIAWSTAAGAASGLARDALSGGLYGLHGFANTLVAYVSARLQERLVIQKPFEIGLLFALATAAQLVILSALRFLLLPGAEMPGLGTLAARMASAGILGPALVSAVVRVRAWAERWRERRRRRLKMEL